MQYIIQAEEEWRESNEYDDSLRGLSYDLPDSLLSVLEELGLDKEDLDEYINEHTFENLEQSNTGYAVFYNQTIRSWDVRVQFDFVITIPLGDFDSRLSDSELRFEGSVDRDNSGFTDSMIEPLNEYFTDKRKRSETTKQVLDFLKKLSDDKLSEDDKETKELFLSYLEKFDYSYNGVAMKDFRPDTYVTVADEIDDYHHTYVFDDEKIDEEFSKLIDKLKEEEPAEN